MIKKQRNTYKKWFKTEATLFTIAITKRVEYSKNSNRTWKNGDNKNNETTLNFKLILFKFFDFPMLFFFFQKK